MQHYSADYGAWSDTKNLCLYVIIIIVDERMDGWMDGRMDWTVFQRYDIDMMCHQMPLKSPEKIMDYG